MSLNFMSLYIAVTLMLSMMQVHIAYLPGRSNQPVPPERIQALVKTCSRQLQIQERLTQEIADGVDALTGAGHMQSCLLMRYLQKLALNL